MDGSDFLLLAGTGRRCKRSGRGILMTAPLSRQTLLDLIGPIMSVQHLGYAKYVAANTAPVRERYPTLGPDHRYTSD